MSYQFYLETPRLILLEMRPDDAASFFLLNEDPEVLRYTGDKRFKDMEDSRQFLEKYPSISYLNDGYGRWTCIKKHNHEILGWCGLRMQENWETDLGYRLHKRFWNRGYASEAGFYSLLTGFKQLKLNSIIARADERNIASWRVMEKLNMKFSHKEINGSVVNLIYKINSEDFNQSAKLTS